MGGGRKESQCVPGGSSCICSTREHEIVYETVLAGDAISRDTDGKNLSVYQMEILVCSTREILVVCWDDPRDMYNPTQWYKSIASNRHPKHSRKLVVAIIILETCSLITLYDCHC